MNLTDAAVTAVVITALKKPAGEFLTKVFGPAADELGLMVRDRVAAHRHANLIKIVGKAKRHLDKAGVSPKVLPLSIIHPMLHAASLEDNEELQDRWAALLANAADPRQLVQVLPSFSSILQQLTPADAKLFSTIHDFAEQLYRHRYPKTEVATYRIQEISFGDLAYIPGLASPREGRSDPMLDWSKIAVPLDNIRRLGLLDARPVANLVKIAAFHGGPSFVDHLEYKTEYRVTALGSEFMAACRKPNR